MAHVRNRHQGFYDFKELIKCCPNLAKFVTPNPYGDDSIDFSNPKAVKTLNQAILKLDYIITWDLPEPFLSPPIPSRADYIHTINDLSPDKKLTILDIGVGANCIYPLIGHREYGWRFVGTDIDPKAIAIANGIIQKNGLSEVIELRLQTSPLRIFEGVVKEPFDISICNPPFHASPAEAHAGTRRKWKNLGIKSKSLNFGGQNNELWCPGGEVGFITRMIQESIRVPCKWFTALVSKETSLPLIYQALDKTKPSEIKTIPMGQGQKKSRIVAWTY